MECVIEHLRRKSDAAEHRRKKRKAKERRTPIIKIRITGGVILAIVIVCVILKILNADPSSVFLKIQKMQSSGKKER